MWPGPDEIKWLSFVTGYLRPAVKHGAVEIWLDGLIKGGADWEREIEHKLRACDVFILLVSNHSMASSYVVDKEIAVIHERQANGEDAHFYPLLLTPTTKIALDQVRDKNLRPRDGQPFSKFSLYERHERMCEAANEIVEIAGRIGAQKGGPAASAPTIEAAAGAAEAIAPSSNWFRTSLANLFGVRKAEPAAPRVLARGTASAIGNRDSLRKWFEGQSREFAVAIATRAALRVAPLVSGPTQRPATEQTRRAFIDLTINVFRCNALVRVVGKYPTRANALAAYTARAAAARDAGYAAEAADVDATLVPALAAAAWAEIRADIAAALRTQNVSTLTDLPL